MALSKRDRLTNLILIWKLYKRFTDPNFNAAAVSVYEQAIFDAANEAAVNAIPLDLPAEGAELGIFQQLLRDNPFVNQLFRWVDELVVTPARDGHPAEHLHLATIREVTAQSSGHIADGALTRRNAEPLAAILLPADPIFGSIILANLTELETLRLYRETVYVPLDAYKRRDDLGLAETDDETVKQRMLATYSHNLQRFFENLAYVQQERRVNTQQIAQQDAGDRPSLTEVLLKDPTASPHQWLTSPCVELVLGSLRTHAGNISRPGSYIGSPIGKNAGLINEQIVAIIETLTKDENKKHITGPVTVSIPISTNTHWTLLTITFNQVDGQIKITAVELSDSIGGPSQSSVKFGEEGVDSKAVLGGILALVDQNLFVKDCEFNDVHRNVQRGDGWSCGYFTIQEALHKVGKKLGGIATDASQDGRNAQQLAAAIVAIARARLKAKLEDASKKKGLGGKEQAALEKLKDVIEPELRDLTADELAAIAKVAKERPITAFKPAAVNPPDGSQQDKKADDEDEEEEDWDLLDILKCIVLLPYEVARLIFTISKDITTFVLDVILVAMPRAIVKLFSKAPDAEKPPESGGSALPVPGGEQASNPDNPPVTGGVVNPVLLAAPNPSAQGEGRVDALPPGLTVTAPAP